MLSTPSQGTSLEVSLGSRNAAIGCKSLTMTLEPRMWTRLIVESAGKFVVGLGLPTGLNRFGIDPAWPSSIRPSLMTANEQGARRITSGNGPTVRGWSRGQKRRTDRAHRRHIKSQTTLKSQRPQNSLKVAQSAECTQLTELTHPPRNDRNLRDPPRRHSASHGSPTYTAEKSAEKSAENSRVRRPPPFNKPQ